MKMKDLSTMDLLHRLDLVVQAADAAADRERARAGGAEGPAAPAGRQRRLQCRRRLAGLRCVPR